MRLFNARTKRLESFNNESKLPEYAILSHTWDSPEDEIAFHDLNTHRCPNYSCNCPKEVSNAGTIGLGQSGKAVAWDKVKGTCDQALAHGYDYVWIDTFYIDKSSSVELQEAINSMFRWYEKAQVCFVYLSDVSTPDGPDQDQSEFRRSRWFTRGWTLQELLAPSRLVFFDKHWRAIGEAGDLKAIIGVITKIRRELIAGHAGSVHQLLCRASIAERMSWASRRHTTRPEDMAYCLLGIFDIQMPMIYGEGGKPSCGSKRKS